MHVCGGLSVFVCVYARVSRLCILDTHNTCANDIYKSKVLYMNHSSFSSCVLFLLLCIEKKRKKVQRLNESYTVDIFVYRAQSVDLFALCFIYMLLNS